MKRIMGSLCGLAFAWLGASAVPPGPAQLPLLRVVDLNLGETQDVELADGAKARVKLLALEEQCDPLRGAIHGDPAGQSRSRASLRNPHLSSLQLVL